MSKILPLLILACYCAIFIIGRQSTKIYPVNPIQDDGGGYRGDEYLYLRQRHELGLNADTVETEPPVFRSKINYE